MIVNLDADVNTKTLNHRKYS